MANLESKTKYRKESRWGNRFYTALDMAIIKKDEATKNAQIKRGERKDKPNNYITVCGCGVEGCFIHGEHDNWPQKKA